MAGPAWLQGLSARKEPQGETGLRRTLGTASLVALGIGAIIGAGLFSLTGIAAAENAGPAVTISFMLAALGCAFAGLCYSELAGMIPSAGSAYAYAYASMGELVAWIIGWDLLLEYAVAAGAVSVSWSSYLQSLLHGYGIDLPHWLAAAPAEGGVANLPAAAIVVVLSLLLIRGVGESALVNSIIVAVKVTIVLAVIGIGAFYVDTANWHPFIPDNTGTFGSFGVSGVLRGAGIVFFAYLGFDAVSTTAAEAKDPQRSMPIGILGSLAFCTVLYIGFALVLTGMVHYPDMKGNAAPDRARHRQDPVRLAAGHGEARHHRRLHLRAAGRAAGAKPDRVRDGRRTAWCPPSSARCTRPGTRLGSPTWYSWSSPAGSPRWSRSRRWAKLVSVGTLLAFAIVCGGVIVLRRREPDRKRPFRVPGCPVVPLLGIASCLLLMLSLPWQTWVRLAAWFALGMVVYFAYSHRRAAAVREQA